MEKLYYNGDILTLEDKLYIEAILIRDGIIVKTGDKKEVEKIASEDAEYIDLKGRTLMPSFMDAHSHFSGYASKLTQVNLQSAHNFKQIIQIIQKFIEVNNIPKGEWVQADGYDQNFLEEGVAPDRNVLDEAAPCNPLVIKHQSGHMGVFNSLALERLDINPLTLEPQGGKIEKKNSKLTGYIEEVAYMYYISKLPVLSNEEFIECIKRAQDRYAGYGITTVQEGYIVPQLADLLLYINKSKIMNLDIVGYIDIQESEQLKKKFEKEIKVYNNHLKIQGYKTFLDGSPQARTAWMRTPYKESKSEYYSQGTQTDTQIKEKIEKAMSEQMQLLVHCNGDAACEQYIEMYKKVKEHSESEIRPVIIHAQLLDTDQLARVKKLEMIPSFFVAHVYYYGDVHIKNFRIDRAKRISPAKSAFDQNILFTFHQDSPVIEPNMLETIWVAVNRITRSGKVLGDEEKISPLAALKAVTKNVAYQYFEENEKGTLIEGKIADMVILDHNILKVDPMDIKDIQIVETIKNGETIYKNPSF